MQQDLSGGPARPTPGGLRKIGSPWTANVGEQSQRVNESTTMPVSGVFWLGDLAATVLEAGIPIHDAAPGDLASLGCTPDRPSGGNCSLLGYPAQNRVTGFPRRPSRASWASQGRPRLGSPRRRSQAAFPSDDLLLRQKVSATLQGYLLEPLSTPA